jgi:SP family general alpha glucoside:H+ symporter-like MFS transporter
MEPRKSLQSLAILVEIIVANCSSVGTIIGGFINGFLVDKFGYRRVILVCLVLTTSFIFMTFFAPNIETLFAGELLCGIPWGVFATMAPAYASEVCPTVLRGYFAVYVDQCWIIGQLIAAGVMEGFSTNETKWAYRIPFGLQWMWPVPLFVALWFAPESPWWLCRHGKIQEAEHSLRRLAEKGSRVDPKSVVAEILHTQAVEVEIATGSSYWDCFKGVDRRRTEIVCLTYAAQNLCGLAIGGTPTYFFSQAGVPTSWSFDFTVGILALGFVCVCISCVIMTHVGRRTLYVGGLGLLALILLIIGILAAASESKTSLYVQASLIFVWATVFYLTLGPICYPIIAETSSMRLRQKSVSLARLSYYIVGIIIGVLNPYMVNNSAWGWKGKTCFFYAGTCGACFVWAFFRLPETKGRTYEELDLLFARKISARKFSRCVVDVYANDNDVLVMKDSKKEARIAEAEMMRNSAGRDAPSHD